MAIYKAHPNKYSRTAPPNSAPHPPIPQTRMVQCAFAPPHQPPTRRVQCALALHHPTHKYHNEIATKKTQKPPRPSTPRKNNAASHQPHTPRPTPPPHQNRNRPRSATPRDTTRDRDHRRPNLRHATRRRPNPRRPNLRHPRQNPQLRDQLHPKHPAQRPQNPPHPRRRLDQRHHLRIGQQMRQLPTIAAGIRPQPQQPPEPLRQSRHRRPHPRNRRTGNPRPHNHPLASPNPISQRQQPNHHSPQPHPHEKGNRRPEHQMPLADEPAQRTHDGSEAVSGGRERGGHEHNKNISRPKCQVNPRRYGPTAADVIRPGRHPRSPPRARPSPARTRCIAPACRRPTRHRPAAPGGGALR